MTKELPRNKLASRPAALVESPVVINGIGKIPFENPGQAVQHSAIAELGGKAPT